MAPLDTIRRVLLDAGYTAMAMQAEDIAIRLSLGMSAEERRRYADMILPRGHRGRVRLALLSPFEARALALMAAIVRSG